MIPRILMATGALFVFGVVNWQVAGREHLRTSGRILYLDLAPVDPRSLMQGDYMALNFHLAQDIANHIPTDTEGSRVVILKVDGHHLGHFDRIDDGSPINADEQRLRFRMRDGRVWLGTNAFFFQEGTADRYRGTRYGEFRVNDNGDAMLVDLKAPPL